MASNSASARALAQQVLRHRSDVATQFVRYTSSGNVKSPQPNTAAIVANMGKELMEMMKYIPSNIYSRLQISSSDPPPNPSITPIQSAPGQGGKSSASLNETTPGGSLGLISNETTIGPPPPPLPPIPPPHDESTAITTGLSETGMNWQHLEARTKYLVKNLEKHVPTLPPHQLIHHVEALFSHIFNHDGTREVAIHLGIYKVLFKILKLHETDIPIMHRTRELLAILGYNEPVRGRGIRILSLDGGGIRGLVAIEVLRVLERLTGKRTHELFDYICGVSTGSILAFLLGVHSKTLDEAEILYKELGKEIFKQNSWYGTASMLWSHSYYHAGTFENILKKHIGEVTLISHARNKNLPRVSAISTVVNQENITPYVFRTYTLPVGIRPRHPGGCRYEMWEAVRASAAAPTYFNEHKLGKHLHQDGGVMCNNPSSVALSESKALWQGVPLQCVVSIGTGRSLQHRADQHLNEFHSNVNDSSTPGSLSWKGKFLKVLDSATDTESVHHTLNELLPSDVYFRFNPYVTNIPRLDEAVPQVLDKLQEDTRDYLDRNIERAILTSQILNKQKRTSTRVTEYLFGY